MSVSPAAAPTQRHAPTSQRLSGKEMMWLNGLWHILPLPGTGGPQSLQPPWPLFRLSTGLLRAGHPNCSCPQTNPQCILRSQGFPHRKSHQVPLASTSLRLLDRRQKIPSRTGFLCGTRGRASALTLSMPGLSPLEGRREGSAEALSQRQGGSFKPERLWLCSCPAQAGRVRPAGVGAVPMLHNKKGF